jgi:transcriptional regulator with XRE-family HTH domain
MPDDSSNLRAKVAANVKAARMARAYSQEHFANLCGYHRTYIGAIERGERNITLETLQALAGALGVSARDLLS